MLTLNDFYAIPKDFIFKNGEIEHYRLYSYL